MKRIYFSLILLTGLLSLLGCQNSSENSEETTLKVNTEIQQLHDQVMLIHDDVMPHMGELMSLKTAMTQAADTLDAPLNDSLIHVAGRIEAANDAMMGWMRQFKARTDAEDTIAAKAYYEEQMVKITEVKEQMTQALNEGRAVKGKLTGGTE
jgi:hypothetical protein